MVRPALALEREGEVGYRQGPDGADLERLDYLELIARVTAHIPDKGQVMARYYGLYANAHRGKVRKAERKGYPMGIVEEEVPRGPRAAQFRDVDIGSGPGCLPFRDGKGCC
jgi:Putative transposase